MFSVQEQGTGSNVDSTMYWSVPAINQGMWRDNIEVGSNSTPAGTPFTLTTWLVNADWINYLTKANHLSWWKTPGPPPESTEIQSVTVIRLPGKC